MRSGDTALCETPKKSRQEEYQTTVNGRYVLVVNLTEEQAKDALCDAYDALAELEKKAEEMTAFIETWRNA